MLTGVQTPAVLNACVNLYTAIPRSSLSSGRQAGSAQRHQQLPGLQHRAAAVRDGRRRAAAICRSLPARDVAQAGGAGDQRAEKP